MPLRRAWAVVAVAVLAGCDGGAGHTSSESGSPASTDGATATSVAVIREVTQDEYPVVFASCLQEAGFPHEVSSDGSFVYGPYPAEQAEAFEEADARCEQQYPIEDAFSTDDFTPEQWDLIYDYQVEKWAPCMKQLGIDLGTPPTRDRFLANPHWVDDQSMIEGVRAAVAEGRLDNYNDWFRLCPDYPSAKELKAADN